MDPEEIKRHFPSAQVYCNSELLACLQTSPYRPFRDSKAIVDLPLKRPPEEVLQAFKVLGSRFASKAEYLSFLSANFLEDQSHELHQCVQQSLPLDYNEGPPTFTDEITCLEKVVIFAHFLKKRWVVLCREFPPNIRNSNYLSRTSLIPLPHRFFIPGGRFRECYYWDTLWTVKGLIASDMIKSAQDSVRNLLHLVQRFGFVPNGNRVYYVNRTQPPILTEAVQLIYEALENHEDRIAWLREASPLVDKEISFFHQKRSIAAVHPKSPFANYSLSLYSACTIEPRPESYAEDLSTANLNKDRRADFVFHSLASAAESGWDFSSRWFPHATSLSSLYTEQIIPVCLNSFLLRAERTLSKFYITLASSCNKETDANLHQHYIRRVTTFQQAANRRNADMVSLFWQRETGTWTDFDMTTGKPSPIISAAATMPIWAGCGRDEWCQTDTDRFINFLTKESGLLDTGRLLACTVNRSHEQWDFPNCWAPLVEICVEGLLRLSEEFPDSNAKAVAKDIGRRFVGCVFRGWDRNGGVIHEKYDCTSINGERGSGGEYVPQTGFGWTNGTALWMMRRFSKETDFFQFGE